MHHVLVTGSAGAVGRPTCAELARRGHHVRGFDRRPTPDLVDAVQGEVGDREAVARAAEGMDTIIHFAAIPDDTSFPDLVEPNVLGLFHVMDAARRAGAARVILASSVQVASGVKDRERLRTIRDVCPTNHYGLTKAWAEQMGEMYARCFELSVLAVRIGWVVRHPETDLRTRSRYAKVAVYLSYRDTGRFFAQAVEAKDIGFAVVYAVGRGGLERFDMEPARRVVGFEPEDAWPDGLPLELLAPEEEPRP
jgi:nucleoside-diphosphate-sugar epimerase